MHGESAADGGEANEGGAAPHYAPDPTTPWAETGTPEPVEELSRFVYSDGGVS